MKKQDIKKIPNKNVSELLQELTETKKELSKLKIDMALKKVKNTNLISEKKRHIARLLTVIAMKGGK